MPEISKGESESDYVKRCIPYVMSNEGASQKEAAAKCHGMYQQHKKKGTNYEEFELGLDFNIAKYTEADEKPGELVMYEETVGGHKYTVIEAVAVIGNRFMKGVYFSTDELKKTIDEWNGTLHDINHRGTSDNSTSYPYKRSNIEYFIGFQKDARIDTQTNKLHVKVYINHNAPKYEAWRNFIELCQDAGKIPNVSMSVLGNQKYVKASELPSGTDFSETGYSKDEYVRYAFNIRPRALTTGFEGTCSDKHGCGLGMCECEIDHADQNGKDVDKDAISDINKQKIEYYQRRIKRFKGEKNK